MSLLGALLPLLGLFTTSSALRMPSPMVKLKDELEPGDKVLLEEPIEVPLGGDTAFGERILLRFEEVDADGDGVVSMAEMREGFGHKPAHVGEGVLRQMLTACAGGDERSQNCTRQQMLSSVGSYAGPLSLRSANASSTVLYAESLHVPVDESDEDDTPCGPSAGTPAPGFEGVQCAVRGARCVRESLMAWSLKSVCAERACVCDATDQTKRLAKVGLFGAALVSVDRGFFSAQPADCEAPACGKGWTGRRILDRIHGINQLFNADEQRAATKWLRRVAPWVGVTWEYGNYVDTELVLYKSDQQSLTNGSVNGKVCMFSWQSSTDQGDWKLNAMKGESLFSYAPQDVEVKLPTGTNLVYEHMREKLMQIYAEECCTPSFQADKLIISGHSRGAGLSELHAIDAVVNWRCAGKDLGAKDISLLLVAPPQDSASSEVINGVFSCSDPARCLSGSVVTLATTGDFTADPGVWATPCRHPSEVYRLPCYIPPSQWTDAENMRCHNPKNYLKGFEDKLSSWGDSCGGSFGDASSSSGLD